MSEKSKGNIDTYASGAGVTPTRVPKNPLLSASVTGLTIDDYPNKPFLLPAAPPIVHETPINSPSLATIGGETKALVTVGKSSNIDSESLHEINLNTPAEESLSIAEIDVNTNLLVADPNDSILSQAALSFSALPSVASTVLSTFSKRLYAGSNSREQTPDIQNFQSGPYDSHIAPRSVQATTPPQPNPNTFYDNTSFHSPSVNLAQNNFNQPIEPPKLYGPGEVLSKSSIASPPLATTGAQNSYRLSAKKKSYAPVPGLSGQVGQFPVAQSIQSEAKQQVAADSEAEERKAGLFSLTNLGPSGILQNISGLVTGNVNPSQKSEFQAPLQGENHPPAYNLFKIEDKPTKSPPSGQNFFNPTVGDLSSTNFNQSPDLVCLPTSKPDVIFEPSQSLNIAQQTKPPDPEHQHIKLPEASGINFFNPHNQNISAPIPTVPQNNQLASPILPAVVSGEKPPSAAGPGSFRLQKGTKLYANPLKSTELASVSSAPVGILNPFAPPTNQPTIPSSSFFTPNVPTQPNATNTVAASSDQSYLCNLPPTLPTNSGTVNFFKPHQTTVIGEPSAPPQQNLFFTPQGPPQQQQTQIQEPKIQSSPFVQQQKPQVQELQIQSIQFVQQQQSFVKQQPQVQELQIQSTPFVQQQQESQIQVPQTQPGSFVQQQSQVQEPQIQSSPSVLQQQQSLVQQQPQVPKEPKTQNTPSVPQQLNFAPLPAPQTIQPQLTFQPDTVSQKSESLDFFKPDQANTTTVPGIDIFQSQIIEPVVIPETPEAATKTTENVELIGEPVNKLLENPPIKQINDFAAPPAGVKGANNPFRRNSGITIVPAKVGTSNLLASFFTPIDTQSNKESGDFDIFAIASQNIERERTPVADLESNNGNFFENLNENTDIASPQVEVAKESDNLTSLPPPIGFDNVLTDLRKTTTTNTNSINFFNQLSSAVSLSSQETKKQENPQQHIETSKTFFDHISSTTPPAPPTAVNSARSGNEEQILQNFFNNPPLSESDANGIDDLNYAILQSGYKVEEPENRSFSNIVEPASSEYSEYSELNNSSSFQRKSQIIVGEQQINKKRVDNLNADIATDSKEALTKSDTTDSLKFFAELPEDILKELKMANLLTGEKGAATDPPPAQVSYKPPVKHWFFKQTSGTKFIWVPFSHYDSNLLETNLASGEDIVAVEGGRYDVNISQRTKTPVYWQGEPIEVRRCSWFYKGTDSKFVPYEEETAELLEGEFKTASESGEWHKKIMLARGEHVVFHGPTVIVHFQHQPNTDNWGTAQASTRPRVVKRDLEDFTIEQGESHRVDHLLFMVHGIGSACDLRMRSVEEVVDDFRSIAGNLVKSHYKNSVENGAVGRVEVLPISWHGHLHSAEMGIDEKLKSITLESIPKLRNFTNDTLLDVLFYTSPTFCQKIMNTVASSLNEVYLKYCLRHPDFNGGVSLAGHSLGSLILFDLLCHQEPMKEIENENNQNSFDQTEQETPTAASTSLSEVTSKHFGYTVGSAGTGQPSISYAQLVFQPKKFFALGSPIGMFVTIRGIDKLGLDFCLPTCPGFYNIFHPFDPVAYRIEALVNPELSGVRPVLIPHHKGRKRMHLELKETMTRVSADLKQRFMDTFRTTFDSVYFLGSASKKSEPEVEENMANEVNKVLDAQSQQEAAAAAAAGVTEAATTTSNDMANAAQLSMRSRTDSTSSNALSEHDMVELDLPLGQINDGKRIDYVLQEAPLEFFNDYIFALSSHVCYWDSADTILFVMKEIYAGLNINPDNKVPQNSMTIERPNSRNNTTPHPSP